MQLAYIGDKESVTLFGVTFLRGVPTTVTNALALHKLPRNPDFAIQAEQFAPEPDERDTLIAELRARGVKADRRWSLEKLQAAIEAE